MENLLNWTNGKSLKFKNQHHSTLKLISYYKAFIESGFDERVLAYPKMLYWKSFDGNSSICKNASPEKMHMQVNNQFISDACKETQTRTKIEMVFSKERNLLYKESAGSLGTQLRYWLKPKKKTKSQFLSFSKRPTLNFPFASRVWAL